MRAQKILKNFAIICLILCVIFLAIDIFRTLKINIDFLSMQSSDRISLSSEADEVRYEPTKYTIKNRAEALEEIKKIVIGLKNEYNSSNQKVVPETSFNDNIIIPRNIQFLEFNQFSQINFFLYDWSCQCI